MLSLISTADALKHLNEYAHNSDQVELKAQLASEIVMRHIKADDIPDEWITEENPEDANPHLVIDLGPNFDESPLPSPPTNRWAIVPGLIYAACLLVLTELWDNRSSGTADPLSPAVVSLLAHYRRPTIGGSASL